jgi:hypothetical protein
MCFGSVKIILLWNLSIFLYSDFLVVNQISNSQNNTQLLEYSSQINIVEAIPKTKNLIHNTQIFFPSTKLIIQITSKLIRAPIPGKMAHGET